MEVLSAPDEVRSRIRSIQRSGASIGVVPTMGALHAGHVSLIHAAKRDCDFVVTTVFVNPTQFGPGEDFQKYPRTLDADLEHCRNAGADLVMTPAADQMYSDGAQSIVRVTELTKILEGALRPGHFDGVTTVVAKLFNITLPDRAYFGQKDYQQQLVIRRMVADLNWSVEIVTCPIIREPDGLAMSSRNRYLSAEERQQALALSRSLFTAKDLAAAGASPDECRLAIQAELSEQAGVSLQYAVVADESTLQPAGPASSSAVALVAAKVGTTRLIDNQRLQFRSHAGFR
ncbi:MAG: pantoate--beta-alanine ligase [Planctomycetaceae bacterium]